MVCDAAGSAVCGRFQATLKANRPTATPYLNLQDDARLVIVELSQAKDCCGWK